MLTRVFAPEGELALSRDAMRDPMPVKEGASVNSLSMGYLPASVSEFLINQQADARVSTPARVFGRNPVSARLRRQYRAALGDVSIIDALSQLGPDWKVFGVGNTTQSNAQYLLVGSPGIFCLSVQHQLGSAIWIDAGVLLSDGERLPYLRDAEFSAVRLTQLMSDAVGYRVEVTPCLVLTGCRSVSVSRPPRRVAVMTPRELRVWLRGLSPVFSAEEAELLRTSATANPEFLSLACSGPVSATGLEAFRKVQLEMSQARHVRLSWVTGALVLLWLAAVVGIGGIATGLLAR